MFKKLKLRQRILLGYLVPCLLLLTVMTMVYINLQITVRESNTLNKTASFTPYVLTLSDSLVRIQRAAYAYVLLNGNISEVNNYPKKVFAKSEQTFLLLSEKLTKEYDIESHKETLSHLIETGQHIIQVNKRYIQLIDEGKEKEAIAEFRLGESIKFASQIDALADSIVADDMKRRSELRASVAKSAIDVQRTILIGSVGAIALMLLLGQWIATTISRSISENVTLLSSTTSQIAATITQHERTASQQMSAATETSAAIEQLSVSARRSSEQAATAAATAEKASLATEEGDNLTHKAVLGINSLKDKIALMADQILHLGEQTGQIGNIAMLVKDLSGQINMLALNAAVEAARAGEHGKGFAVVASEVRKLADQSKKSAEQATNVVADIQKATNSSVMMTEESSRIANEVTQLTQNVAELFNNLSNMVNSVNENAQQVMLNAKQQSAAFVQVVEATNSISAGARETAAGISETKIGVQNLNEAAENLKAIM